MLKYNNILINKKKKFNINFNSNIFTDKLNLWCLPCILFDPVWILFDCNQKSKYSNLNNFDDFFKKTNEKIESLDDFFLGKIYAYHWHSRNNYHIEKNSYFEKIEKIISH